MAKKKAEEAVALTKLRVIIDTEQDVFRDIEIKSSETFFQLHQAILNAFQFSDGEMASFYVSDENWEKGLEIPLMDMGESAVSMDNTPIHEMASAIGDKLLYVYDFMRMWIFYVEVMEIKDGSIAKGDHQVVLTFGDAPNQEDKEMEMMFDHLMVEEESNSQGEDEIEEDEFGFGDDDHFDSNEFDGYYEER